MGQNSESGETSDSETIDVEALVPEVCIDDSPSLDNGSFNYEDSSSNSSKKVFKCNFEGCSREFSRPWRLAAHQCTHTGELPFKCPFEGCNRAYTSPSHLRRHKSNAHQPKTHEPTFRCPFPGCEVEMKYQWNIKKHYRAKHEPKKFKCTLCTESFMRNSQLRAHIYWHTGVPPLQCPKCNAGFLKETELKKHMVHHKEHACDYEGCNEVFQTWTLLRKHFALKHPKEFICDYCKKVFHSKPRLRSHILAHTDPSERDVVCCPYPNCERFYYEKKNLDHHIRVYHEKRKKYSCTYKGCDRELSCQLQILWPATYPCETTGSREITEVKTHGNTEESS